jgi:hypothetical protein
MFYISFDWRVCIYNFIQVAMSGKTPRETGYELCAHTCPDRFCESPTTNTIFWKKEGSSCQRHAGSALRHPRCAAYGLCEQAVCLGRTQSENKQGVRGPISKAEFAILAKLLNPNAPSPTPSRSPSPIIVDEERIKLQPTARILHVLFIPDPTTKIMSKSSACNDLAYVTTAITTEQRDFVSNLQGYIHILKNSNNQVLVCMQEWVNL